MMNSMLIFALCTVLVQDRPLPVPFPPAEIPTQAQPLADLSGWFVASEPFGPSAILHIEAAENGWTARIIMRPTTDAAGHVWCDIVASAERLERTEDGAKFTTKGVSVDAGPRWFPEPPGFAPSFGLSVYEREAIITDMGSGQALCGPRSELTGIYSRVPD